MSQKHSSYPLLVLSLLLGGALALTACGSRCRSEREEPWPLPPDAPFRMLLRAQGGHPASMVLSPKETPPWHFWVYGLRSSAEGVIDPSSVAGADKLCGRDRVPIMTDSIDPVVAFLADSTRAELRKPPVNSAAIVEKAQWRLEDILKGQARKPPKTSKADQEDAKKDAAEEQKTRKSRKEEKPGLFGQKKTAEPQEEVHLRSLVKMRREGGPPVLVATGEAGCKGIIAVMDRKARGVWASDSFLMPGPECSPLVMVPPADLDGDGRTEIAIRSGDGEPDRAVFRGIYKVSWKDDVPSLERYWGDAIDGRCAGQ